MNNTFTYDEAYERYREHFKRQAVCNHRDMDDMFDQAVNWKEMLELMQAEVGQPSKRHARPKRYH